MPHHFKHDNEDRSMSRSASAPAAAPKRRRGGQELPDEMQDRPEQNAGYDAAVHHGPPADPQDDLGIDVLRGEGRNDVTLINPDENEQEPIEDIDDRAERGAIGDVRRREKRR
jgi:hypothetical protein